MLQQLGDTRDTWSQTIDATRDAAPKEVVQRMESHIADVKQLATRYENYRTEVLRVQSRVTTSSAQVGNALSAIRDKRDLTLSQIFNKDSPALWEEQILTRAQQSVYSSTGGTMAAQAETLKLYLASEWSRMALALGFLAGLAAILWWSGSTLKAQKGND